jgi:hypothetical protein
VTLTVATETCAVASGLTSLGINYNSGGDWRTLVRFNAPAVLSALQGRQLLKARLRVKVMSTPYSSSLDVHRMTRTWNERGATWECANDTVFTNTTRDCAAADVWGMWSGAAPFVANRTSTVSVAANQAGDGCSATCKVERGPEICGDGLDNDGDTRIDCLDTDCLDTDCLDTDCRTAFTCAP